MFIQTEPTPNPATLKFLPGLPVLEMGTADFPSKESAENSPLAQALFRVKGVVSVFFGMDFITITKSDDMEWPNMRTGIEGAIMAHFQTGAPAINVGTGTQGGHADHAGDDSEIVQQIKELLDTRVRPAVAQDGGDITFHGYDDGIVYLHMQGACAGCPSSAVTLKMGIENLLRHFIPEVVEVRSVLP